MYEENKKLNLALRSYNFQHVKNNDGRGIQTHINANRQTACCLHI